MSDRCPPVTPRLHELARLAVRRLQLGHEPLEVVLEALAAATTQNHGLPPAFDHLTPQMREIACVLFGAGEVRISAIAKALGKNKDAVQSQCHRMKTYQILTQSGRGFYALNLAAPEPKGLRFGLHTRRIIKVIKEHGPMTVKAMATTIGKNKTTIARKMRAMKIAGLLRCPRFGLYDVAA
jgi:hypothetical protein